MPVVNKEVFSTDETLWVQPEGPGTDFQIMGDCYTIGATTEPQGDLTPHFCRDLTKGAGNFKISKQTRGTPGSITFQLEAPKYRMNNLLRTLTCPFDLQAVVKPCGNQTTRTGWEQIDHYRNVEVVSRGKGASASRQEEVRVLLTADASATNFEELRGITFARQGQAEIVAANSITVCDTPKCADDCGAYSPGCQTIIVVHDRQAAAAARINRTVDGGTTWVLTLGPFLAAEDISDVVCDEDRIIIADMTDNAAAPPQIAYSANIAVPVWTLVAMPAPAVNGGLEDLFKLDTRHLWACGNTGYIYFCDDWGLTWATQDAGVASGGNGLNAIMMVNEFVGYAVGAADTVVKTVDGGGTWAAATATGSGAALNTVYAINEDIVYAGSANGQLRVSFDGAVTWAQVRFQGDGVGNVRWVEFYDQEFGYMIHDDATPDGLLFRSTDGGATWEVQTTPANDGLNRLVICDPNNVFVAGENVAAGGPLAFIGEATG